MEAVATDSGFLLSTDPPLGLVSEAVMSWVFYIGQALPALTLLGVVTNTMNLVVYARLGLHSAANVCFFALSVASLCCLLVYLYSLVLIYVNLTCPPAAVSLTDLNYVTSWYYRMFYDVTVAMTTFIAVQRGCCVAFPFYFKGVFTRERVAWFLFGICLFGLACYLPVFTTSVMTSVRNVVTNSTKTRLIFQNGGKEAVTVVDVVKKFALTFAAQFLCVSSMVVIQIEMHAASRFKAVSQVSVGREKNAKPYCHDDPGSDDGVLRGQDDPRVRVREVRVVKQVMVVTGLFVTCNTPQMVASVVARALPGVDIEGRNRNLFWLMYTVVNIFELFNCSVTFFIYFTFNARFREMVVHCHMMAADSL